MFGGIQGASGSSKAYSLCYYENITCVLFDSRFQSLNLWDFRMTREVKQKQKQARQPTAVSLAQVVEIARTRNLYKSNLFRLQLEAAQSAALSASGLHGLGLLGLGLDEFWGWSLRLRRSSSRR